MGSQAISPSQIVALPKGGGAHQDLGEQFSPDLHTETGNFLVPLALPPGHNGFQPQLNLVYRTESGNGHFGLTDPVASYRHGCDPPDCAEVCVANSARVSVHPVSSAPGLPKPHHNSIPFNDRSPIRIGQGHADTGGMSVRRSGAFFLRGQGAQHGLGEKFSPDLHTGTGNFTVPIALPPGRNGVQPQLDLAYRTGNGNGNGYFGFGWSVSIPGVMRKTSKGIPRYCDEDREVASWDTFVLSGAENLVSVEDQSLDPLKATRFRPLSKGPRSSHHHIPKLESTIGHCAATLGWSAISQ